MDTQREQEQTLRTEIYLVLSALFRSAPSEEMIEFLTSLEVEPSESAMQKAWIALQLAAKDSNREALEDEYQDLFIGIGRGEVMPFGSWHMTGAMMEKPLAEIRHDLELLGFERDENVKEPEDHIAALCEVMSMLTGEEEDLQQAVFNKHIAPWFNSFTQQLENAESANFYKPAAQLCEAFLTLEQVRFSVNTKSSKHKLKIDVKNVTDYE
ncbi:molecular chaperone [Vibrio harveyi]|uniref:TorD/DmsD family molecular chaperone n=1 Tax=Vibrio TaxID=662 RepID=UPI00237E3A7D|nr:molecular chaperone TorD family protein [Vibrio harveyi]EKO3851107.1 molecular chaperone TorD family protein [Vibrio harveyi]ELH4835194.1 molecular chaperone TorD family protein [Vibrio harveyi]HDM8053088.1 molecular chaperone TorD family protein [Vibrio harveyi]HDM8186824.1 molecular chaperone TorD family protein [Vibrio harveyi]HDZ3730133.1 molecular chaperone TorD family protein [Vibrio harveyi]